MKKKSRPPVALGGTLLTDEELEASAQDPRCMAWADREPNGEWDLAQCARNSPAGRRLRAVRRAVEESPRPDAGEIIGRAARAAVGQGRLGVEARELAMSVIGAAIDHGYLDVAADAAPPTLVPGPDYVSQPSVRGIDFHHPEVSLAVGSRLVINDTLRDLAPTPPGVESLLLPLRLLERVVLVDTVPLADVVERVTDELQGQRPDLLRHGTGWLDTAVKCAAALLVELGWAGHEDVPAGGRLHARRLGLVGFLLTDTLVHGSVPPGVGSLLEEAGYLPADGGFVDLRDVPVPLGMN